MKRKLAILQDKGGAVAIEFALILPLLMMMLGATFEYSRVLLVENSVRNIIDMSVRQGVVTDMTSGEVATLVDTSVAAVPGMGDYVIDVTDGTELSITVTGSTNLVLGDFLPDDVITFEMTALFPR